MYSLEIEDRIRRLGFAVVGDLGMPDVAGMRISLEQLVERDIDRWRGNPHYRDAWMVHNLLMGGDAFIDFLENQVMHEYLSRLLSPSCILYSYTSSSLPPHGSNYSRRIHVDAQAECPPYITNVGVLLALDDFTEHNGAPLFLPGSHLEVTEPDEATFLRNAVPVYPRAGEAVIFNARTYHLGGENQTDKARHAITLNACRHWMKQRFDYPRLAGPGQVTRLGRVGQRFLGMDSRVPTSLEEYYVAPEQRMFKAGQT